MALKLGEPLHFHADDHEYAELYLERAIANAHLGNIEQAQQDFAETLALLGVNKNFVFPDDIQPSSTAARIFSKMQSRLEGKTEYNIWAGAVKRALNTRPR